MTFNLINRQKRNYMVRLLLTIFLVAISFSEAKRAPKGKGIDIHARATWKVSDTCDSGCANTDGSECGTEAECSEFFNKERQAEYLMYTVFAMLTIGFLFVCCVWSD